MAETTVQLVAQLCEASFYQDFRPATAFFKKEHFRMFVIAADGKLKMDEFKEQVALNLRSRKPNAQVVLSSDNYDTVVVPVNDGKVVLPSQIMTFPGVAGEAVSVTQVMPTGGCSNFMRTTQKQKWQAMRDKETVYWYPVNCGIEFLHLQEHCNQKEVIVTYIPELNPDSRIQSSREWAIVNMVTIFLKSAKDGVVIDTSNDSNPNTNVQMEINRNVLKALQQR